MPIYSAARIIFCWTSNRKPRKTLPAPGSLHHRRRRHAGGSHRGHRDHCAGGSGTAAVLEHAGAPIPQADFATADWGNRLGAGLINRQRGIFCICSHRTKDRIDRRPGSRRRRTRRCRGVSSGTSGTRQGALWRGHQRALFGSGGQSTASAQFQQRLLSWPGDCGARAVTRASPPRADAATALEATSAGPGPKGRSATPTWLRLPPSRIPPRSTAWWRWPMSGPSTRARTPL